MRLEELDAGERQLWDAYARGRPVDVRHDSAEVVRPAVRAECIMALLLGAGPEPAPGERPALRLSGASVTGRLDLRFAEISAPIVLTDCDFDESPLLQGARFRELSLTGCALPGLTADMAQVDGRLVLSHCHLSGPLVLTRTQIHSDLDLSHTVITAPGGEAISAVRLSTGGDLLCTDLAVQGGFRLSGGLDIRRVRSGGRAPEQPRPGRPRRLSHPDHRGLHLPPRLQRRGTDHPVGRRRGGGDRFLRRAAEEPGDIALEAVDVTVSRNFDLGAGLTVSGGIKLDGSRVGTRLSFHDATLTHPTGTALSLRLVQARETDLRTRQPIDGTVDADNARLGTLHDAPGTWPARLRLSETAYDALAAPLTALERLEWVRRSTDGYLPQPYEQLAATYRRLGHEDEARTVLLAKQRHRRVGLPAHTRVWGYLQDATVGYGYRPARAALWLMALLALGTFFFATHPPAPLEAAKAPPFSAVFYALDLLIPIIGFGQKAAFAPHGGGQWLAYGLTAAGWVLATTVTAGISRAISRP